MNATFDSLGRLLRTLRVSVTDRCNLRCAYCMPTNPHWMPTEDRLTFGEVRELVALFSTLGVERVRLTGGEPLLRPGLPRLIRMLRTIHGIREVALTTNGVLLERHVAELAAAGLDRVNVSLDTTQAPRFLAATGVDAHAAVVAGIDAARAAGVPVKLNAVIIRGFNDDELTDLLGFAAARGVSARFIEYMNVGAAPQWSRDRVVPAGEILSTLTACCGSSEMLADADGGPARYYRLRDGTRFGIIAADERPFCASCSRSRLTADGRWFTCLHAPGAVDLRSLLREGTPPAEISAVIRAAWHTRPLRGDSARAGQEQGGDRFGRRCELVPMYARGG